ANSPFRLPQNTWVNCARSSGALPPPSPPAWLVQSSLVNSLSVYFLDKARRAGTLHLPTSDNSRSGDPHQIRQRIRARSKTATQLAYADIPRMTPKPAWRVVILQRRWKPDGRYGWLPAARAARTMVEGLIWLFSLASGRIPPVDCA